MLSEYEFQKSARYCIARLFTICGMILPVLAVPASSRAAQPPPAGLTSLYRFTGSAGDGSNPYAGLAVGGAGVLYGTTMNGGTSKAGTVFSLSPPAPPSSAWTEKILYSFAGGSDGANPYYAVLAIGSGGILYGTTAYGGASNAGTVYALTPPASSGGSWTENVIYSFTGGGDGGRPLAGVVAGDGGVLYGTASAGGIEDIDGVGGGTVFSLTPPASPDLPWTESVLYSFSGLSDGNAPCAPLAIGSGGVLYGTTDYGGASNAGTVFSLSPPASPGGVWSESVLLAFTGAGAGDGAWPLAGVALGDGGVLYGTTQAGGTSGRGTVFSLTPPAVPGDPWTGAVLYSFTGLQDGSIPTAGVVPGIGGVLYGVTEFGGVSGAGAIFSLTPPASLGGSWTESVVYSFTGLSEGGWPVAGMAAGGSGEFYGTACCGGTSEAGTVFRYQPASLTISGQVTQAGTGLSGVTITLSGSLSGSSTTDGSGNYSLAAQGGGSYTVTPSMNGYIFTPASQTFDDLSGNQSANFAVTTYTISGEVTLTGGGLSGVAMTLSGSQSASSTSNGAGNYSFVAFGGGNDVITPALAGYTFTPPSLTFNDLTGNQTANFAASPVVAIYAVSGQVTVSGSPLNGVTVTLSGSQSGSTNTDSSGNYSFSVPGGANYTVTPSLSGYTFLPASLTYVNLAGNQSGANFAASLADYTISGEVTLAGSALSGAALTLSGSQAGIFATNASGKYSFSVQSGGTYTVTPSMAGSTFSPASATFNDVTASQTANFAVQCGTVSPSALDLDATSQVGPSLQVTAAPGCAWNAAASGFIAITSGASGTGNGTVTFTVTANTSGAVQTGTLTVAGQTVTVTQRATAEIFADVIPSAYYFDFANLMDQAGITAGCSTQPLDYCPEATTTRGEMAVFLIAAIESGHSFTYTATPYFTDVAPDNPYFKFIQKLKDLGITTGCTPTTYCPDAAVTRGETAVFIIASRYDGTAFTYPSTPYFTDVPPSNAFFPFVQKMAQAGITGGCGGGLYCPDETLTRSQMAVFIVAGLLNELLPAGTPFIASAAPNSATPGQVVMVRLTGVNTHFVQGATQVAGPAGITPSQITVLSATSLTVELAVGGSVTQNPKSIVVTTGTEEAVLPNGLLIQ